MLSHPWLHIHQVQVSSTCKSWLKQWPQHVLHLFNATHDNNSIWVIKKNIFSSQIYPWISQRKILMDSLSGSKSSSVRREVDSNVHVQVQTSWNMQKVVSQIYSKWTNPNWFDFHCLSIWRSPIGQSSLSIFLNITLSQPNTLQPIS